jgi:hypothetical protein
MPRLKHLPETGRSTSAAFEEIGNELLHPEVDLQT